MTTTESTADMVEHITVIYLARVYPDLREAAERVAGLNGMSLDELALLLEEHFKVSD